MAPQAAEPQAPPMMKNISAWAIKHPVPPVVLFVVLFFMGIVAFIRLPINLSPDISFPLVRSRSSAGRRADRDRDADHQKIEGSVASVGNVKNITSWAALEGQAIRLYRVPDRHAGRPRSDRRARRSRQGAQQSAARASKSRWCSASTSRAAPSSTTPSALTDMTEEELSWFVDNAVTKRLLAVQWRRPGAARRRRQPRDPRRARSRTHAGARAHRRRRQSAAAPAQPRLARRAGRRSAAANSRSACSAGRAPRRRSARRAIMLPGGRVARLWTSPTCATASAEIRTISRLNGRPATTFGVFKSKGSSDVTVIRGVQARARQDRARKTPR